MTPGSAVPRRRSCAWTEVSIICKLLHCQRPLDSFQLAKKIAISTKIIFQSPIVMVTPKALRLQPTVPASPLRFQRKLRLNWRRSRDRCWLRNGRLRRQRGRIGDFAGALAWRSWDPYRALKLWGLPGKMRKLRPPNQTAPGFTHESSSCWVCFWGFKRYRDQSCFPI